MKKEMGPRAASWHDMWVTHFKRPEHHRFEGRSLAEVAELMGLDVVDAICELLLLRGPAGLVRLGRREHGDHAAAS